MNETMKELISRSLSLTLWHLLIRSAAVTAMVAFSDLKTRLSKFSLFLSLYIFEFVIMFSVFLYYALLFSPSYLYYEFSLFPSFHLSS